MHTLQRFTQAFSVAVFALACLLTAHGQVTTGSVRGVISDPNSAAVTTAKVTITRRSTGITATTQTAGSGQFEFNNLPLGNDYEVTVGAPGFKTLTLSDVKVQLNQVTDLSAQLTIGAIGESVTVTSGGTELVDTTTANLSKVLQRTTSSRAGPDERWRRLWWRREQSRSNRSKRFQLGWCGRRLRRLRRWSASAQQ